MVKIVDSIIQVVYILDQVRVSENEMLNRIKKHGLDITLRILIVCPSVVRKT